MMGVTLTTGLNGIQRPPKQPTRRGANYTTIMRRQLHAHSGTSRGTPGPGDSGPIRAVPETSRPLQLLGHARPLPDPAGLRQEISGPLPVLRAAPPPEGAGVPVGSLGQLGRGSHLSCLGDSRLTVVRRGRPLGAGPR